MGINCQACISCTIFARKSLNKRNLLCFSAPHLPMHPSSLHTFCSKRITCTLGITRTLRITLLCWIPQPWFIIISSDQQVGWWHLLNGVRSWLCGIEVLMVVVPRRRFCTTPEILAYMCAHKSPRLFGGTYMSEVQVEWDLACLVVFFSPTICGNLGSERAAVVCCVCKKKRGVLVCIQRGEGWAKNPALLLIAFCHSGSWCQSCMMTEEEDSVRSPLYQLTAAARMCCTPSSWQRREMMKVVLS